MAVGQKTLRVEDLAHEPKEGTTSIMYCSEAVAAKLVAKNKDRYKILGELKEKTPVKEAVK